MRGGTSKGRSSTHALPAAFQVPGPTDMLLRVIVPDPYAKQIDGMGATSSTSKFKCAKRIERITTSITFSVKYRSINPLLIGAVIVALSAAVIHLPLTKAH